MHQATNKSKFVSREICSVGELETFMQLSFLVGKSVACCNLYLRRHLSILLGHRLHQQIAGARDACMHNS